MFRIEDLLKRIRESYLPQSSDLVCLLSLSDEGQMKSLFAFAEGIRKECVGNGIFLRGIIEFSNFCRNSCHYCGLNKDNRILKRYRMTADEIVQGATHIASCGISTVVLQSGESEEVNAQWLAEVISEIKEKLDVAVTISVGERAYHDYKLWKDAGADRYLLKIETSDKGLYESLHPGLFFENRMRCLRDLRYLGFEVGSGNIVGLKGQTLHSLAEDIIFFKKENFDMIGIGPFIPHPGTALANADTGEPMLALKVLALVRIVTGDTNIPATTALAGAGRDFRIEALHAGANVLMPNFTPQRYRRFYELYPGRRCVDEAAGSCLGCMELMAKTTKRFIDYSKGGRKYAKYAA